MNKQPAATINLNLYEDSIDLLGLAKVTLPSIIFPTVAISGVGMMGNMDVPLLGMVDSMSVTFEFLDINDPNAAVLLSEPRKHHLDMRAATENWDVPEAEVGLCADKYVLISQPKSFVPGTISPMAALNASIEHAVYYYAGYRAGKQLWEIDKRNMKCVINGVDYMADVRRALGKA